MPTIPFRVTGRYCNGESAVVIVSTAPPPLRDTGRLEEREDAEFI